MRRQWLGVTMLLFLALTNCSGPATSPVLVSTGTPSVASIPLVPTRTNTPDSVKSPTEQARDTPSAVTPTPDLADFEQQEWSYTSPDGNWIALTLAAYPKAGSTAAGIYTQLKVSSTDGAAEWVIVDRWSGGGLGYTIPQPLLWSRDGQYLCCTNRPVTDGCGLFVDASDLWKVNLRSGSVVDIMPSSGSTLSLSPDETVVAYIRWRGRALVIRDLLSGKERQAQLNPGKPFAAGHIIWSPDGTTLLLTLALQPCSGNWAESTSIVRVQVPSLEQTTAIREDERLFITAEWSAPDRVLLKDKEGEYWWMDSLTNQVTKK